MSGDPDRVASTYRVDERSEQGWATLRGRVSELRVLLATITPSIEHLARRTDRLEADYAQASRTLTAMATTQAAQTAMIASIESGVRDLKDARSSDGTRFRQVVQILAAVASSIAAVAVSVIAIVTR